MEIDDDFGWAVPAGLHQNVDEEQRFAPAGGEVSGAGGNAAIYGDPGDQIASVTYSYVGRPDTTESLAKSDGDVLLGSGYHLSPPRHLDVPAAVLARRFDGFDGAARPATVVEVWSAHGSQVFLILTGPASQVEAIVSSFAVHR